MAPEISASLPSPPSRLPGTGFAKTNSVGGQSTMQKVRQAQADQQSAAQKTAAAQASAQAAQNNLLAAQAEERQAAERVSLAQAEYRQNNQPQQAQTSGKNINVLA